MPEKVNKAAATAAPSKAPLTAALYEKLKAEEARLEAELAPAREFYEKVMGDPKLAEARATIKRVNAALLPVKNELAVLARAGGAKGMALGAGAYDKGG